MARLASTLALTIWGGFLAASAVQLGAGQLAAGPETVAALGSSTQLSVSGVVAGSAPHVSPAVVGILGAFGSASFALLVPLNSRCFERRRQGEAGAAAFFVALSVLWMGAMVTGVPTGLELATGAGPALALAASFGALLFDHLMEPERPDEAFAASSHYLDDLERILARARRDNDRS